MAIETGTQESARGVSHLTAPQWDLLTVADDRRRSSWGRAGVAPPASTLRAPVDPAAATAGQLCRVIATAYPGRWLPSRRIADGTGDRRSAWATAVAWREARGVVACSLQLVDTGSTRDEQAWLAEARHRRHRWRPGRAGCGHGRRRVPRGDSAGRPGRRSLAQQSLMPVSDLAERIGPQLQVSRSEGRRGGRRAVPGRADHRHRRLTRRPPLRPVDKHQPDDRPRPRGDRCRQLTATDRTWGGPVDQVRRLDAGRRPARRPSPWCRSWCEMPSTSVGKVSWRGRPADSCSLKSAVGGVAVVLIIPWSWDRLPRRYWEGQAGIAAIRGPHRPFRPRSISAFRQRGCTRQGDLRLQIGSSDYTVLI